ncbi:MAG: envelope integrity protein Cei [Mycolicibacterium insubricum]|nr:envelope integrity protein Cei [Mycobacterium sp.]
MVAQITDGTTFDRRGLPFRRRNYLPGIIVAAVLAVITAVVWSMAASQTTAPTEAVACTPPPMAADGTRPSLGEPVTAATMSAVAPAKPADTRVRVLNASGQGGQASEVSGALRDLGFAQPDAGNDPLYAGTRLSCQGQIRFGEHGKAAAAAVWLVAPCTELYRDDRTDSSVDLAIGTDFTAIAHSPDIETVLAGLRPESTEPVDQALVKRIHAASC